MEIQKEFDAFRYNVGDEVRFDNDHVGTIVALVGWWDVDHYRRSYNINETSVGAVVHEVTETRINGKK